MDRFIDTVQLVFVRTKSDTLPRIVMGDNSTCGKVEFEGDFHVLKHRMVFVRIVGVSKDRRVLLGKQEGEPILAV